MSDSSKSLPAKLFAFLSGFGLATSVLVMLLVLTFLGTLEQAEHGLVASQARYFESAFIDRIDIGACWRALAFDAYWPIGNVSHPMPLGFGAGAQLFYTVCWILLLVAAGFFLFVRTIQPSLGGRKTDMSRADVWVLVFITLLIGSQVAGRSLIPGGYTLMAILFVNMLLGGVMRIRKSPKTIGVIISHFAILFMIAAGAVTHHFAKEGNMNLREGQTADEFLSFHDRVIEIEKVQTDDKAKRTALVIDESKFRDLSAGKGRTFTSESLPFDLMITGWKKNAQPKRDTEGSRSDAVDGYFIQEMPQLDESGAAMADEQLASACVAIAKMKKGDEKQTGILWEFAAAPWTVTVGEDKYLISLVHRSYKLPFAIRLDQTEEEKHPGTQRARRFTSNVTKLEDGREEKRVITMNEPVRSEGYAVFQSTFSSGEQEGSGVKSSGFMIVENPADHWPLISCIIVAEGLLLHFLMMLARFIKVSPWAFSLSLIAAFNAAFALAMKMLL